MDFSTTSTHSTQLSSDLPRLLTVPEAGSLLRTTPKAMYARVQRRQIPGVTRIGRKVLIRTDTLLDWLHQQGSSFGDER